MKNKLIIATILLIIIILFVSTLNEKNKTYAVGDTLASTVIVQSQGTTWPSGASGVYNTKYTKEDGTSIGNDYRYIGANVNNYVKFNDDMYQIIGVFDENTHGKTGQQLVKIIRARPIASYSWGVVKTALNNGTYSDYSNDWTGSRFSTPSNLNVLLNEFFYNKTYTSTTYGNCLDWSYIGDKETYKSQNCTGIVGYGIQEEFRNYIETAKWYLYAIVPTTLLLNDLYLCERGMYTDCMTPHNGAAAATTNAKIGLIYYSDYSYASGFKESGITTKTGFSRDGSQNWMFKGHEWTLAPSDTLEGDTHVQSISNKGSVVASYGESLASVRPTFYLKSGVYVTGGNGSFDNPYTVACDNC